MLQAELNEQFAITHEISTVMAGMVRLPFPSLFYLYYYYCLL
jgi:hypothetical protein